MSAPVSVDSFQRELARLVEIFAKNLAAYKSADYDEASLRQEFLNPFFRALGWDIENKAGLIPQHREVEIESRTQIGGRQKRADYLFRTHPTDRFVCEAKKPAEELHARSAFQTKRYAWNKGLPLAVLTDFEEIKVFIVGGKPDKKKPDDGLWKTWSFRDYPLVAREIWDLLAHERVAAGGIDQLIESLPKKSAGKGKAGFILKPDRSRALDTDFLNFLDEARRELASDLLKHNDRADLLEGTQLNEAVQRILDRLLFLRICEDRDIDTGRPLERILRNWRDDDAPDATRRAHPQPLELREEPPAYHGGSGLRAPKGTLWHTLVRHFRSLDRRPPSHIPFFNGNLFKPHFSEELVVGDDWLVRFLAKTGDEDSEYLFHYIPVEILGTIYEHFLGKIVRPQGRGVTIEEKPEVRKAGGVYYTPRYVVEYIVGQTVGKLLDEIAGSSSSRRRQSAHISAGAPSDDQRELASAATFREFERRSHALRILDPACGSGSFLLRAFERVCEHWQTRLTRHPEDRKPQLCWLDPDTSDVHLGVDLKRRILRETIHGVDLDPQAVEVTQLSLYLKMLENENRFTLARDRDLFGSDEALLPPLESNIKCGNSLIASDFSLVPDDLVRVKAFDWPVQFPAIMKAGGFDAVVGNPPYIRIQRIAEDEAKYLFRTYQSPASKMDLSLVFLEKGLRLVGSNGRVSFICTSQWLAAEYGRNLRKALSDGRLHQLVDFGSLPVFADASTYPAVLVLSPKPAAALVLKRVVSEAELNLDGVMAAVEIQIPLKSLGEAPWTFGSLDIARSAKTAGAQCKPLSEFGKAYIGTKCGLNEAFVLSRSEASALGIEKGVLIPYAYRGAEVDRYLPVEPDAVIIYPYRPAKDGSPELFPEAEFRKKFPRAFAHLESFKAALRNRQDSRKFYARGADWYRHLRAGSFNYIRPAKLALKGIALRCSVGLLKEHTAFDGARCPCVILDDVGKHSRNFFLGVLNSKLATVHLKAVCPPKLHGYIEFSARAVTGFPVRVINFSNPSDHARHDRLVGLVDKLLALTPNLRAAKTDAERHTLQNAVTATDQQLDALVYELYGLTEEEIRLVEGHA